MKILEPLKAGDTPDPELFKLMADSVRDYAIFLLDPAGCVATWNSGARLIKQYEAAEIVGKHFSVFYTEKDIKRDWPAHELRLAMQTGRFEDEGLRVRKDGTTFWANVIITPIRDATGRLLAYSKITRDLTERRLHEEKLKLSEERFRLLVEGVQDYAIYMLDVNGMVTSWNSGANRIKGYESHEIIGQHFSKFYALDDVTRGKPATALAMARLHGRAEDEGWRVRKNGSRFWARVVVTALLDPAGNLRGFAKVTQDLTQRKHAEAIESSRNNINEFIAILAHELRNPLAPIRSAVHLMTSANEAGNNPHAHVVKIIDRQSSQLMRIVDDILDISRVTRGVLTVSKNQVAVEQLLLRAIEAARPGIDAQGHTLLVNTANAPEFIVGDEVRLAQAITNILNNACRYTPSGGTITMDVSLEGPAEAPHRMVVISIGDNGQGIDPALIHSIFGLFIQGPDRRAVSRPGLGVGLALSKSIVELHQGTITAFSEGVGKGSEFVIRIPLSLPMPVYAAGDTLQAPQSSLRILVVDDNADAAFLLTSYLESLGHEVVVAYSGRDALTAFQAGYFPLVLMDVGMPGMDGLELARQIRLLPRGTEAYLVAVSGWGKADDQRRSREAGIDLHLVKPVEAEQLAALLEYPALRQDKQASARSQLEAERAAPAAVTPGSSALHVLVVDDNMDSATTTGWLLETMGHRFSVAYDGASALALAQKLLPDVILLDIGLPDMSGYEVCRQLRNNPLLQATTIVAQTGRDKQGDRDAAREAGFDGHLVKPLNLEDVAAVLASVTTETAAYEQVNTGS